MQKLDLAGQWSFQDGDGSVKLMGSLPGSNYLDLMAAGQIADPFWELNEKQATLLAEKEYVYSRMFQVEEKLLESDEVCLVIDGLDTLADISLNGVKIASCDNAHRVWRIQVKPYLLIGENEISIFFASPVKYIREANLKNPLVTFGMADHAAHIRKPQCHFGWDWGPNLPPVGIHGGIHLEASRKARIADWRVEQHHTNGSVSINIQTEIERFSGFTAPTWLKLTLTGPDGKTNTISMRMDENKAMISMDVQDPQLWWCNGLGGQPLYELSLGLMESLEKSEVIDSATRKIGLREIHLSTDKDQWGRNFQFVNNGVPIFAKGADWIPSDSFVTRTTRNDLDFYIRGARDANMNMLRVWGGGYYESEAFYDLCDQYGILVWQDFAFACAEYPLNDPKFLENVQHEVIDQVRRLRHRASLALWCGNNEIKIMGMMFKNPKTVKQHDQFFFYTLRDWVKAEDDQTPYWASSPSSTEPSIKGNDLNNGDTHLWQVWHGMQPLESFRKYPTRFCSEFGVESLPSRLAIQSFSDNPEITLFDPVMQLHQKSVGGNEKMLYYVLSKYRNPGNLHDFAYLSQLIQSETVRMATEFWRRNFGRCNGAIYWQYNDCWPVASWAGIDYLKQYKAVQYRARHFNQMLCVSAEMHSDRADLYVINDHAAPFAGVLNWRLVNFSGSLVNSGSINVKINKCQAVKVHRLLFKEVLGGVRQEDVALILELKEDSGAMVSTQSNLLVADKNASLQKPQFQTSFAQTDKTICLQLTPDTYSRFTFIEIDGITSPLSDNFFDIEAGQNAKVEFTLPEGMQISDLLKGLRITTLMDVEPSGSLFKDKLTRLQIALKKHNIAFWLIFKFLM